MEEKQVSERRRWERYPIYCPLEYKAEDNQPKEPSTTLNISEGGAMISARRALIISSNVILKFRLRDEMFFMIGKVRHARPGENNHAYELGVEFWEKPKTFTKKLYEELEGIKNYQKRYKEEQGSEISLEEASLNWYKNFSE